MWLFSNLSSYWAFCVLLSDTKDSPFIRRVGPTAVRAYLIFRLVLRDVVHGMRFIHNASPPVVHGAALFSVTSFLSAHGTDLSRCATHSDTKNSIEQET